MIKNVYIASSSRYRAECQKLATLLEIEFGITITRKWWQYYFKDYPEYKEMTPTDFYSRPVVQMIRELDFKAVEMADVIIIINKDDYKPTGALVEVGYALALQKIVIFLGKIKRCTLLSGCIHITTREELFELIERDRQIEDR